MKASLYEELFLFGYIVDTTFCLFSLSHFKSIVSTVKNIPLDQYVSCNTNTAILTEGHCIKSIELFKFKLIIIHNENRF